MQYLSTQDINIRRWIIIQKISELGSKYCTSLKLGKPCSLEERNSLLLLEGVLELLDCYYPVGNSNTGIIYQIFSGGGKATTLEIFINGLSISGEVVCIDNTSLTDAINNYQSQYLATQDDDNIIITSNPNIYGILSYIIIDSGYSTISVTGTTTNVTKESNCYKEKEIQTLLDKVDKEYNLNFKPINFTYTEN